MGNFFIIGLPRSRTAWLSNFLTYDDMFCYHEGLNGCSSISDYKSKLGSFRGDSNTGLMLFNFEKHFPEAKVVIIDSEIDKASEFSKETYGEDITETLKLMKERLDGIKGLHINVNDINDKLKEIWEYVSDKTFNKERTDMLVKLNIQVNDPHDMDIEAILNFKEDVGDWLT